MTANARMGLIAGGLVAGAVLVCGGGAVGVYWLAHRGPVTGAADGTADSTAGGGGKGKPLADRPLSEGSERDDESYVLGHRWWKRPPARGRLAEIVGLIVATNAGSAVFVDDIGRTGKSSQYDPQFGWLFVEPEDLSARRLCIECRGAVRSDRKKVLREIRLELDAREFRDGPGR